MAVYPLLVTPGHNPAVHIPDCTRDPARLVGKQKDHRGCHIPGFSDPANRMKFIESLQGLVNLVGLDEGIVGGPDVFQINSFFSAQIIQDTR